MGKRLLQKLFSVLLTAIVAPVLFGVMSPLDTHGAEVKKALTRGEIDPRYKWRLEDIYATDEDWVKDFQAGLDQVQTQAMEGARMEV